MGAGGGGHRGCRAARPTPGGALQGEWGLGGGCSGWGHPSTEPRLPQPSAMSTYEPLGGQSLLQEPCACVAHSDKL